MKDNLKDRSTFKISRSITEDTVNEVYKIHLSEELIELSNEFCKYYNSTDIETGEEYFAIIYDNSFLYSINNIDHLCKNPVEYLNTIYDYSIATLSTTRSEHLVVIVDRYDPENNLANYLTKGSSLKPTAIMDFIGKFISIFSELSNAGIYCYNLNPKNILMQNGEFLALKEFINSYPNYYQEEQYLAPELVECHPVGRYMLNIKADIYALGISMFEAYSGKQIWNEHKNIIEYNYSRFENGTAKYLLSKIRAPEKWRVFFKWILHDEASIRWDLEQAKDWLAGKITKAGHESISDNKNIIAFNDANYSSLKSISYALFNNWSEAVKFLKDNKLFKWAIREQLDPDSLEEIRTILDHKKPEPQVMMTSSAANSVSSSSKISKLLSLLDPSGSIRYEGVAFSAASIPNLIHYLQFNNKRDMLEKMLKFIREDPWLSYLRNPCAAGYIDTARADLYKQFTSYIYFGSIVKGSERLCYTLNVNAICQSPLVKDKHVATLPELVRALDIYAEKNPKKFNIDKNIVAFIAAKLDILEDIRPAVLANFPKYAEHPVVRSLSVFNIIEQYEPEMNAPNISSVIISDLKDLFSEHIHNTEFKKKIVSQLTDCAKEGKLNKVISVLSNQQQFIDDYNGYYEACASAKALEEKIKILSNEDKLFSGALLQGQKITVLVSYVLWFVVAVIVII